MSSENHDPLVIVGGGAAGHACAMSYRNHGGDRPVILISADDRLPYFRPHLTKELLTGDISIDSIELTDRAWYSGQDVQTRLSCDVTAIDLGGRVVATDSEPIAYSELVLATGSRPSHPSVPGADHDRVFSIRSARDSERVLEQIETGEPLLVIGSGFVGCEVAASVRARGIDVSIASAEPAPLSGRLGDDGGEMLTGWLRDLGIDLRAGRKVFRLEHASITTAHLDDGTTIECGWVIVATGSEPNATLARAAGLAMGNAVPVDASMRTEAPSVYAIGDIAHAFNAAAGRALRVEHWGDAERMGSIAGAVAAGTRDEWAQAPGFWTSIAGRTLKYVAWGDGWDRAVVQRSNEGFTIWYAKDGTYAGVLTFEHDEDLAVGRALIESQTTFDR